MTELFTSINLQLIPREENTLREEIFISPQDAQKAGINSNELYCIFGIQPLMPGPKDEEYATRVVITPEVTPGSIQVNRHFMAYTGFQPNDERFWFIHSAPTTIAIQRIVIEQSMDQGFVDKELNDLRFKRNEIFVKRCILVEPKQELTDLTFRMQGRASFYVRSIYPEPATLREKSIYIFEENTQINLFIPHRKSGVDMIVVVDGSGSMDIRDYLYEGQPKPRLDGVKLALDLLFQSKLVSGSRVSSIAAIVFGGNAMMLYPVNLEMRKLETENQLEEIRKYIRLVNDIGLKKMGIDRSHTSISDALKFASDLLDLYAQENNEKMVILLSDGADWHEDSKETSIGEIVLTSQDPAVLADSMHQDSNIRIHTIAISDESTFLHYFPKERGQVGYVPNKSLLQKIAICTDGMFLETPTADQLARIFEELGIGATYPIN